MTKLINGTGMLQAIEMIFEDAQEVYAAVAYWSGGAAERLCKLANGKLRVVLDVNSGGTSARELEYLIEKLGENVRVHPNLHTKIYASKKKALVGSSNASAPGLHLRPTNRVEASYLCIGREALEGYVFAKELFDTSPVANYSHVEICKNRFGRNSLADSEAPEEAVDLLTALWERKELLDELPLILTNANSKKEEVDKAFDETREELGGSMQVGGGLIRQEWTDFSWKLREGYNRKLCLSLHAHPRGGISGALVRPWLTTSGDRTFAQLLPFNELRCLKSKGRSYKKLEGNNSRIAKLSAAMDELMKDDRLLRVKDLSL